MMYQVGARKLSTIGSVMRSKIVCWATYVYNTHEKGESLNVEQ